MTTKFEFYSETELASDAEPMDAAGATDVMRGDSKAVMEESTHMADWPIDNGQYTTTSSSYDGATFVRLPPIFVPAAIGDLLSRWYVFRCVVKLSSGAQTGTLRVFGCPRFAVPANSDPDADFALQESAGFNNTTLDVVEVILQLRRLHCFECTDGCFGDEPGYWYYATHLGVQAKVTGGATLTFAGCSIEAIEP